MKGQKSVLLYFLAIVSLIGIGVVLGANFFSGKSVGELNSNILGTQEKTQVTPTPFLDINSLIQTTYQSGKNITQQKMGEVQQTVVSSVEKEIANLTQSQMDALKQQICRDWGVIPVTPTKNP